MCWTLRTTSGGNPIGITGLAVMSRRGWRTWGAWREAGRKRRAAAARLPRAAAHIMPEGVAFTAVARSTLYNRPGGAE